MPRSSPLGFQLSVDHHHPHNDCLQQLVHAESLLSCPTLLDPVNHSLPGSSVHGILQVGILEWVAIPFSRGSSRAGVEPGSLGSPASAPPGKPHNSWWAPFKTLKCSKDAFNLTVVKDQSFYNVHGALPSPPICLSLSSYIPPHLSGLLPHLPPQSFSHLPQSHGTCWSLCLECSSPHTILDCILTCFGFLLKHHIFSGAFPEHLKLGSLVRILDDFLLEISAPSFLN